MIDRKILKKATSMSKTERRATEAFSEVPGTQEEKGCTAPKQKDMMERKISGVAGRKRKKVG
jgi:hypothetical protein